MISFISGEFLFFVAITCLLYFLFPIKHRWFVLLGASIYFYYCSGIMNLLFVLATAWIAYITTYNIEKIYISGSAKKKKARRHLILGIVLLITIWLYAKIGNQVVETAASLFSIGKADFRIIVPLGISYYTFSIIGYMADVYWRKEKAEHHFFRLLLYMIYFPHILQGPIPRYKKLALQLTEGHPFQYQSLCYGLQRMVWGYFKKMVIANRLAMLTGEVFGNYGSYEGLVFVIAVVCSAIEIYCDFSGCMDIALGISEVLGIRLDENFQRPFFSKSVAEFWRRWHITLGTWFKDYVYMPLIINPKFIALCKRTKTWFGKQFAKKMVNIIPLALVWLLTGLWHNTGLSYIMWGCYWGMLIILSMVFTPEIKKLTKWLKINTDSKYFRFLQIARTFILYLFSRLLTAPGDIKITGEIINRIFMKWNPQILFDRTLYRIGLDKPDIWVAVIAVFILWAVEFRQERGIRVREKVAALPLVFRWGIYYLGILSILIFGVYGSGEDTFIYMFY